MGDEQYDQDGGYQDEAEPPLADEKGEIDPMADGDPEAQDEAEGAAAPDSKSKQKDRRRSRHAPSVLTTSTGDTGDLDSYYTRSPTLRAAPARLSHGGRRHSSRSHHAHAHTRIAFPQPTMHSNAGYLHPSRVAGHAFPQPASQMPAMQEPAFMAGPPASPISLYGPAEQARRVEAQRRSRRLSLTAAPAGPVPGQGAANFHERTMGTSTGMAYQAPIPEEEEEQLDVTHPTGAYPMGVPSAPSARVSRDGFAHRAKEWKKLQKM